MSEPTSPHDELRSDRRSFLKIAGIGGAVLVAAGCDSSDTPDPIDPGDFNGLMGTVTNEDDGSPLADVTITVEGTSRMAVTDANGMYAIENLPAGTYTVMASTANFEVAEQEDVTIGAGSAGTANFALAPGGDIVLDFSDDFGPLNYAYALEQLEAAFYAAVVASPYAGISDDEMSIMMDLAAHEGIHRDFLAAAIAGAGGTLSNRDLIPALTPDFSAVDFTSRASVLATALTFEDLGVGAYNGAGRSFSDTEAGSVYLTLAGKIVSVEARHASVIAGLIAPNTIAAAGVIDPANGLDRALAPTDVLTAAAPFLENGITAINV